MVITGTQVVIVANAEDADPAERPWATLETALTALDRLAPGVEVFVGWAGHVGPAAAGPDQTLVELPPALSDWEGRAHVVAAHATADRVVLLAADAVVGPDTVPLLLADHDRARASDARIGFVAAHSDRATPTQLGRPDDAGPTNGDAGLLSRIELTAAVIDRALLLAVDAPLDDTLGDAILSWELGLAGFEHRLSSAYVHRLGPAHPATWGDSSGAVPPELAERLRFFRPDLFERLAGPAVPPGRPTPADEATDPVLAALRWRAAGDDLICRLGAARCLREQGRTIEAVEALGDFEPTALSDDDARFVSDLAWLIGDQVSAIEVCGDRPALADQAEELRRLSARHADLMHAAEERGCRPYEVLTG